MCTRPKKFTRQVIGLEPKNGPVECQKVCKKNWDILIDVDLEDPETVKAAEALQAAYRVRKNKKVLMVDNGTGEDKHIGGFHLQLFLFVFKFIYVLI